ncbi:MAG: hypothetical protein GC150_15855 [Rhizobiales bacterium]|nr:hypothetical protein [Hyphomicrobiales bacterium]
MRHHDRPLGTVPVGDAAVARARDLLRRRAPACHASRHRRKRELVPRRPDKAVGVRLEQVLPRFARSRM